MPSLLKGQARFILAFLIAIYLGVGAGIYLTQTQIIFHSEGPYHIPPKHLDIRELFIATEDGEKLYAWWLHTPGAAKTVLFFQENGRNLSFRKKRWSTFARLGMNALLIDYRGFGKSSGRMEKEQDIYSDGEAAWAYLTQSKKVPPGDIIVWGRSLGGAVATHIAQNKAISALVLESTFASMDAMARRRYWIYPTRLLLKYHFPNVEKIKQVRSPVVIIHSAEDRYIPFHQAAALFEAANDPKAMIRVTGSHFDLFEWDEKALSRLTSCLAAIEPDSGMNYKYGFRPSSAAF
jgi:fermentation-respiration switch protein FrsA (DUF1100 family)